MRAAEHDVVIVGAGLAGSLLAVLLGRAGQRVAVYERRPDPRRGGGGRTRSINLALSTRGLHALEQAGLDRQMLDIAVPMRGRMIHPPHGPLHFQPYGTAGQAINSVSRAVLNQVLVEAAEACPGVSVVFGERCTGLDAANGTVTFENGATRAVSEVRGGIVIGADGARSAVRRQLERLDRFDFSQSHLEHGYKELTIPAASGGGFRMEPNALHIWPRGGFMMIALPNRDGSFTCTCFWPFAGPNGFESLRSEAEVVDYFGRVFPDVVPLLPTLATDYIQNPTGSLVTIRCRPWSHAGRIVLVGDAAHAVVPFYGQGANAAFEDCVVLAEVLAAHPGQPERAFAVFEARRREHTDALARLAVENFVEMRDKTGSRVFLWGKKLEHGLAWALPWWFRPLYGMITFSRTPYADAVRRARYQWRVVRRVTLGVAALLVAAAIAAWLATR